MIENGNYIIIKMDKLLINLQNYLIKKFLVLKFFIKWILVFSILILILFKPEKTGRYIGKWTKSIVVSYSKEYSDTTNIK